MPETLSVGRLSIAVDEAKATIEEYTQSPDRVFAWPYYDRLNVGDDPDSLSDGDLLAPTLLYAAPTIRAFAGLQRHRAGLQAALRRVPFGVNLADASEADIETIGWLYDVLDPPGIPDVQDTTLAKLLHRKRPTLVPLYDDRIWRVYGAEHGGPLPPRPRGGRTWHVFMVGLATKMRKDLAAQPRAWANLCEVEPSGHLTPLRALDILAWRHALD